MSHPRVSVFTPSHRPTYLDECFQSLRDQTYDDWEWVVLLNGDAEWSPPEPDPRVRVLRGSSTALVGAVKAEACAAASGDILLELDHDDILTEDCLEEVVGAFDANPDAVLVYSDFAALRPVGGGSVFSADPYASDAPEATPNNVSFSGAAPYHVRAFRRTAYEEVGRFDPAAHVLSEHKHMMGLYQAGDFHHIPECLYFQRLYPAQTCRDSEYMLATRQGSIRVCCTDR